MENGMTLVWGIIALVLLGSSVIAQRLPIGKALKMILVWITIFAAAFVLFLFQDEGRVIWQRAVAELSGDTGHLEGKSFRVRRDNDGHYWLRATVNGTPVRFMVDSGATTTTLSQASARDAGVVSSAGFPVLVSTANGTVELRRAAVDTLVVGNIAQRNAKILIGNEQLGDVNLLGMSFLSSLKSWRVESNILILQPF